jgi:hypothetical protein
MLSKELYDQIKHDIKEQIQRAVSFSDSTGDIEIKDLAVNFEATFQSVLLPLSPSRSDKDANASETPNSQP